MTAPEDDRPVGEWPPTDLAPMVAALKRSADALAAMYDPPKPDPYQALLAQLHEARAEVARLKRGAEALDRYRDLAVRDVDHYSASLAALRSGLGAPIRDLDEARAAGVVYTYGGIQRTLRALLDGEVRP